MSHEDLVPLDEAGSVLAGVDGRTGAAYALKVLDGQPGPWARRRIQARLRRLSVLADHESLLVPEPRLVRLPDGRWAVRRELGTQSLPELVASSGPMRPDELAELETTLSRALDAVRAAGLTHGAVKPGNVLFRADGSAVLTDFTTGGAGTDDRSALAAVLRFAAGHAEVRLPRGGPIVEFGPHRPARRMRWVIPIGVVAVAVAGAVLIGRDGEDGRAGTRSASPAVSSAPAAGLVVVAPPVDRGNVVDLSWQGRAGVTYAVLVIPLGRTPQVVPAGRTTSIAVPVEPELPYCMTVQGTDGVTVDASDPVAIRTADCPA
jgi:hypothetical protein